MIYLASPYTHPDRAVREARFYLVAQAGAALAIKGYHFFCPITHTHPIDLELQRLGIDLSSDFWQKFDKPFLQMCNRFFILNIEGWDQSKGIQNETAFFAKRGIIAELLTPNEIDLYPPTNWSFSK
jgi:hypothetical protein